MVFGFGKKREEKEMPIEPPKQDIVDRILNMRQQGISNNQIIQTLQRENYSSSQIFDAMNQADLISQSQSIEVPYSKEQMEQGYEQKESYEEPKEKIEELVEVIIEEKWNQLVKDISKIVEWKKKIENDIDELKQKIDALQMNIDSLKKGVSSRLDTYDKSFSGVGTSVKAMETAFSKVLPTFTENVNELNRITKKLKQ